MAVPDPPVLDTAIAVSDTQIDLDWTAGPDGGSPIIGYKIERNLNSAGWATLVADTGNTDTDYSDSTLSTGDQADYRISAINAEGTSAPSNVEGATTFTIPAAPVLSLQSKGLTNLHVEWTVPDDGGTALSGYILEWCLATDDFVPLVGSATPAAIDTDYDITGLTNGVSYKSRIRAVNSVGEGPNSNTLTATPATAPSAPAKPTTSMISDTEIDVMWVAPAANGSPITGYKIESNVNGAGWTTLEADTGNTDVIYHDTGLAPGDSVIYRVSAINAEGTSSASTASDPTVTVPETPVLTKTDATGTEVKFSFPEPAHGASTLEDYTFETSLDAGFTDPDVDEIAPGDDPVLFTKSGLTQSTQYWFRVKATNEGGDSAYSNVINLTTEESLPKIVITTVSNYITTLHSYQYGKKLDILIDDDEFDDICVIDARGCDQVQIDLKNTHASKGLTYELQAMTEETDDPQNYDAAVYTQEDSGGNIAFGAHVVKTVTKCYSWILVRAKRQTSGPSNDSELAVIVRTK